MFKAISAKIGSSLYKHSLTEVTDLSSGIQWKDFVSSNDKQPANRAK